MLLARLLAVGAVCSFAGLAWLYLRPPGAQDPHEHPLAYFARHPAWQVRIHLLQGTLWLCVGALALLATPDMEPPLGRLALGAGVAGGLLMAHTMWFQAGSLRQLAHWHGHGEPPVPHTTLQALWRYTQFATWGGPLEVLAAALTGTWMLLSGMALWAAHPLTAGVGGAGGLLWLWGALDWWLQTFWLLDRRPLRSDALGYLSLALLPLWLLLLTWSV